MSQSQKNLRICSKGHKYFKSSDCPVCPVCANEDKPENSFMTVLAAPARRALQNAGIHTLNDVSHYSEEEILKLHGMGPSSIPKLRDALLNGGLKFKK